MAGPLGGIRVTELTLAGAGPFAGACLAMLGAEVIKLERPQGDTSLEVPPTIRGLAHLYLAVNAGTRSVRVDLRDEGDRAFVHNLIASSDVFLQNMRVGVAERLGLGPQRLMQIRPDLVYCSISGYGQAGPLAGDACNDPTAQAFGGFASLHGRPGDPPELFRTYAHLDVTTAQYAVLGVLLGLNRRRRFGAGSLIQLSLLSASLGVSATRVAAYLETGLTPALLGSAAAETAPHRAFRGSDGEWFTVAAVRPEQWEALCSAVDMPGLRADPCFSSNPDRVRNREALEATLAERFGQRPSGDWVRALREANVPAGPVYGGRINDVTADQQVAANGFLVRLQTEKRGTIWYGAPPWKFERTPAEVRAAPEVDRDGVDLRARFAVRPAGQPGNALESLDLPLAGIRVIEVAGGISGPYAGFLLGKAGASVTKIEPGSGDPAREYVPQTDGASVIDRYVNEGKERVCYEKTPNIAGMLGTADLVLIDREERWFDERLIDDAVKRNPSLVVCRLSGYGVDGPLQDLPAAELVVQGMAGYLGSLGVRGEEPIRLGADVAGLNTGIATAQAALAAMMSGVGQKVDVSALGTLIHLRSITWVAWSAPDKPIGFAYDNVFRPRDFGYTTSDRRVYVASGRGTNEHWARFLIAVGLEALVDHPVVGGGGHLVLGTAPYAAEWHATFDEAFAKLEARELIDLFRSIGGKPSIIQTIDEVLTHEQTRFGNATDLTGKPRPLVFKNLADGAELL